MPDCPAGPDKSALEGSDNRYNGILVELGITAM